MTNYAAINARYAVVITRHRTPSAWPGAGADDGDQDADTAPEPLPVEPATPSTAALRSVGGQDVGVVHDPVDHRGGHDLVAEHVAPAGEGQVRGQDQRGVFVAAGDQLKEQVGGVVLE